MRALMLGSSGSNLRLPLVKPCSRCTIPGIDQQTGQRNKQTGGVLTETLRSTRSAEVLLAKAVLHKNFFSEPKRKQDVYFGQNALVELTGAQHFEITVGDVATVEWQWETLRVASVQISTRCAEQLGFETPRPAQKSACFCNGLALFCHHLTTAFIL